MSISEVDVFFKLRGRNMQLIWCIPLLEKVLIPQIDEDDGINHEKKHVVYSYAEIKCLN